MRSIRTDSFDEAYEVFEDLGSGQFAVVRRCKEKASGNEYAAKFVIKRRPNSNSRKGLFREKILQEIEILTELKHKNIISLHDVFETNHEIIIVLELVSGGELFEYISEKDHLSEEEAARFIAQILEGVEHFHSKNIVHLDLKPENVMLLNRDSCLIKIIDFGISRQLKPGEKVMETYGTPEFVAPEIIQYQPISTATDMWSIGVITYILLSGASPFLGDSKQETFANITNIDYSFDADYFGHTSQLAKDFISRLFVKDVRKRATVNDCLEHPWIKPILTKDAEERRVAQINIDQFKSFIARRRWKQSVRAISLCNKIIRKSQLKLSSTFSLESINCISFGKTLLDNGDDFVLTALLCAAEDGDCRNLHDLLKMASLDVNKGNKNSETALHLAAANGRFEIVKLLKENNMKLELLDNNGENALHYSCRCNNYESAREIIEYLINNGISIDSQNKNGESALHIATRYGCVEIAKYLGELGINLDLQDDQLETALHLACWHGFPELVGLFCLLGCDINKKNREGETALIVACARGCIDSVRTLIEHGADLNVRDKRGNTGLHWAVRRHYTMIALMLIQAECNMDILDSNGETALHIACRESLLPIIQTMCALGCRVDIKNKREMTPLHTATEKNEINAVRCLCLAGHDLSATNKDGQTAEQLANNLKFYEIANLLSSLRKEQNREMFIEQLIPTNDSLRKLKVKVLGSSSSGKSTLIGSLNCSYLNSFFRRSRLTTKSTSTSATTKTKTILPMPTSAVSTSINNQQQQIQINSLELRNDDYTKGIEINQCTLSGSNHFSIWEFSGYEPYRLSFDQFLGFDSSSSIHLILYNLTASLADCFNECVYWIEFLRARAHLKTEDHFGNSLETSDTKRIYLSNETSSTPPQMMMINNANNPPIKVLFIGTHADLDGSCATKKEDGFYHSTKTDQLRSMLENYYVNDNKLIDLSLNHYCIDARAAWEPDMKQLINTLIQMKQDIVERLPKSTMFLNRTLSNLQNWRKCIQTQQQQSSSNSSAKSASSLLITSFHSNGNNTPPINYQLGKYPLMRLNQFIDLIRENINPLASEVHLYELIYQLQIMGEIILIESNTFLNSLNRSVVVASAAVAAASMSMMSATTTFTTSNDYVCIQPEWLCQQVLGHFYSFDRIKQIRPKNLNGIYSSDDLLAIFGNGICDSLSVLENIFVSMGLCATVENEMTGRVEYEFSSMNFLSENENPFSRFANSKSHLIQLTTNRINNKNSNAANAEKFVFSGFRLKCSNYHLNNESLKLIKVPLKVDTSSTASPLVNLFYRIQICLRQMAQNRLGADFDYNHHHHHHHHRYDDNSLNVSKSNLNNTNTTTSRKPSSVNVNPTNASSSLASTDVDRRPSPPIVNQSDSTTTKLATNGNHHFTSGSSISSLNHSNSAGVGGAGFTKNVVSPSNNNNNQQSKNAQLIRPFINQRANSNNNQSQSQQHHRHSVASSGKSYLTAAAAVLKNSNTIKSYYGALIDLELFQFRFSSRLVRESCKIDCLIRLDYANAQFIEVRACAPESLREELFYFMEDLNSLIDDILNTSNLNLNLERHYIGFKSSSIQQQQQQSATIDSDYYSSSRSSSSNNVDVDVDVHDYLGFEKNPLNNAQIDAIYSPKDILAMQLQLDAANNCGEMVISSSSSSGSSIRFTDLVCCGSETIRKNLQFGVDLSMCYLNNYTRRLLCILLDKIDPMGRDCNIFAVLLGLEEHLPKIDEEVQQLMATIQQTQNEELNSKQQIIVSKCECVLNEWCKKRPEQATIRNLILKIDEFGRKDCKEMIMNTSLLFLVNKNHDSGIQNSSQTLF